MASSPRVRKVMQATPSRDTAPEKALRSIMHRMGLRFRKDIEPIEGVRCKADVVFRKAKVCVFVDGCFWHGCPKHFRPPKTNTEWWLEKVQDNQERDTKKTMLIKKHSWMVLRYWEHEIQSDNAVKIAMKISRAVKKRINAQT
jgi:DNA mismatch endonuclease, patch repair protein